MWRRGRYGVLHPRADRIVRGVLRGRPPEPNGGAWEQDLRLQYEHAQEGFPLELDGDGSTFATFASARATTS